MFRWISDLLRRASLKQPTKKTPMPATHRIRVKRKGSGHLKVTTDPNDEIIGVDPKTLMWIRRKDAHSPDPGDDFLFDSLECLPTPPFHPPQMKANRTIITVEYDGWIPQTAWEYTINVTDVREEGSHRPIVSDGSPTIKNK